MPSCASVAAVSIVPSATAMPYSAPSSGLRIEWSRYLRFTSPQETNTLPSYSAMNAADPMPSNWAFATWRSADEKPTDSGETVSKPSGPTGSPLQAGTASSRAVSAVRELRRARTTMGVSPPA